MTIVLSVLGTILPLLLATFGTEINTWVNGEVSKLSPALQALVTSIGTSFGAFLLTLLNVQIPTGNTSISQWLTVGLTGFLTYLTTHHTVTAAKVTAATQASVASAAKSTPAVTVVK